MLDTIRDNSTDRGLIASRDNNLEGGQAYALRAIGRYGQDVLAHTIMAPNPAAALARILALKPREAQDATAWVVTRL
jgi:hypothetical protein